ncbi:amidohydrolase family protein [Pyruvatibacter sp.]|uniref:N-acyl-D-amino-acid deacylase family protein n=1 Tax=Pyruvatibacter sp. TaxID=1981328 RepID=UPI0032EB6F69
MAHDLIIRGGAIADGTGNKTFSGDIAIKGNTIVEVGSVSGTAAREINADGALVTPGWVDIHTHYDAQATWDTALAPSSWHGVTTAVMGNCGVGFAPAAPDKHDWLIGLMEGVEDIPGAAMTEGLTWGWESFPEYLEALDRHAYAIDIAAQVPHGAVRGYVMGERGAKNEEASDADIARMAQIVEEGVRAGAVGFSTSRTFLHKATDGEYVPGTFAKEDELFGIGHALKRAGHGVFQMTSNHKDMDKEFGWMERMARDLGVTVTFNLVQTDEAPDLWKKMLGMLDRTNAENLPVYAQVAGRPAGILMGWECTVHPFIAFPSWAELAALSPADRRTRVADPQFRTRMINETPADMTGFGLFVTRSFEKMFVLEAGDGSAPDYEPAPEQSVAAIAHAQGVKPEQIIYDAMCANGGEGLLYFPLFNYTAGAMDPIHTMLQHPRTNIGLGDGGAHCGAICDASIPTFMLTHWVKGRTRGDRLPLEFIVKRQTRDTALLYGFSDRGLIKPGLKADLNIIDLDTLAIPAPHMAHDLPANGRRLVQEAHGYTATLKSGVVTFQNGEDTGARPGGLVRGPQHTAA